MTSVNAKIFTRLLPAPECVKSPSSFLVPCCSIVQCPALTCSLLVEEMLDSASSCRSSVWPFHVRPSRRKRWCSSSSSHAFFQPLLRFTWSCCTFTEISWMLSEGIQALRGTNNYQQCFSPNSAFTFLFFLSASSFPMVLWIYIVGQ